MKIMKLNRLSVAGILASFSMTIAAQANECRQQKSICDEAVRTMVRLGRSQVGVFDLEARRQLRAVKRTGLSLCSMAYKACQSGTASVDVSQLTADEIAEADAIDAELAE